MSEAVSSVDPMGRQVPRARATVAGACFRIALHYAVPIAAFLITRQFLKTDDYVGTGNDNWMRLVEVRDFLAGQGWFDTHQYRLGFPGGTLMHWSRFVDLPIAAMIAFFSAFLPQQKAEAVALAIWPTVMLLPLLTGVALAGWRLAERTGAHFAVGLTALFAVSVQRFAPGAIDHDNLQMALMALATAMLLDRSYGARSFAVAGFLCGASIAIGAETTPYVAVMCAVAAVLWAWEGQAMARAAQAFGLAFSATLAAAFYSTTPPALYSTVRCDSLSVGFFALGALGGGLLFAAAATAASRRSRTLRFAVLAGCGAAVAATALAVAPQCLRSPYAGLDPLLVKLWLNHVSEARSVIAEYRRWPFSASAFYATPVLAMLVCAVRIAKADRSQAHLMLLALLVASLGVTLTQLRGSLFSSLFAVVPLSAMVADVRRRYLAAPGRLAVPYVASVLASSAPVWGFGGAALAHVFGGKEIRQADKSADCRGEKTMAPLLHQPVGLVAGPSNMGVGVLRFTGQRVLAAPYHRNAAGLTAALKIEMAPPEKARELLRKDGVTLLAYCAGDPETTYLRHEAPHGLLAEIARGNVPAYLSLLPESAGGAAKFYRVLPAAK